MSRLSMLAPIYDLTHNELANLMPSSRWPVPALTSDQGATVLENQLEEGRIVRTLPGYIEDFIFKVLGMGYSGIQSDKAMQNQWEGSETIAFSKYPTLAHFNSDWLTFCNSRRKEALAPIGIHFLKPPYPGMPPLAQYEFRCIQPVPVSELEWSEKMMSDPHSLTPSDWCAAHSNCSYRAQILANAAPFAPPYQTFFINLDQNTALNLNHPTTILLLRCLGARHWVRLKQILPPADIGRFEDQLALVANNLKERDLQPQLDELWTMVREYNLFEFETPPALDANDFIPKSENSEWIEEAMETNKDRVIDVLDRYLRPFGQPLETVLIEEVPAEIVELMKKVALNW